MNTKQLTWPTIQRQQQHWIDKEAVDRTIDDETRDVKRAKATLLYWDDVKGYGSEAHALRALDCTTREEAIEMLSAVQTISVFKREGRIVIQ